MKLFSTIVMGLIFSLAVTQDVRSGVITTFYATNNNGSDGGAVFFDINVLAPSGINVQGIELNAEAVSNNNTGNLNIYARSGTYVGNTGSTVGWTLVSSGSGVLQGINNPSIFSISDFQLDPGVTGLALVSEASVWRHRYTNGDGSNQFFSDANLSLTFGAAQNTPFTGSEFSPRVWNGSLIYTSVPEPSVIALVGLTFCAAGIRRYKRYARPARTLGALR